MISVNLSLIPRSLPNFQCTLGTADEAEESDPFTDIEEDVDKLEENELLTVNVSLASHTPFTVLLLYIAI